MALMSKEQQEDNRLTFADVEAGSLRTGRLDYVACWYAKAIAALRGTTGGRAAFVSTNSITQGEQARTMVPLLARNGFAVDFGHQTFKWTSEAPGAAAVHCVIVGFSPTVQGSRKCQLFTYKTITSEAVVEPVDRLNFYLVDGPDIVPRNLSKPMVVSMPMALKGSQATDGGGLLIEEADLPDFMADPNAAPYVRRFVQAWDMLHDTPRRWCLWLVGAQPGDITGSALIRARLATVRAAREQSATESVREWANQPGLFTQDRQPHSRYFAVPRHSSENRRWIPGRFYEPDVIGGNALILYPGIEDWQAALISSSMSMAWIWTFAGRLKSDIRQSPALTYFPVPWPTSNDDQREQLGGAMSAVLDARNQYPDATLADLYDPDAMPQSLLRAHEGLDEVVDRVFGARKRLRSNSERLSLLMTRYEEAQNAGTLPISVEAKKPVRRRARKDAK
jgi:hypothetical protein